MKRYDIDKKYESFKIPDRQQAQEGGASSGLPQTKKDVQISFSDGLFYKIEYDTYSKEEGKKPALEPQKIEPPQNDEIRELFYSMRDIARQYRKSYSSYTRFYNRAVQQDNAKIFYKQAVFMKDFEDDYPKQVSFSSYFPYYQMLGYEQLRTYFTWRTHVRKGIVENTSLSYVFLYIYELLNNVGVDSPQDGLDKLVSFWTSFKNHDSSIDKYVLAWLKDYHIYYNLPQTFKDFVQEHNLTEHYPKIADPDDSFDLFSGISKYDIRKSIFYTDATSKLIADCFNFVIEKIRQDFESAGINFDDALFRPTKKIIPWKPFKGALFYQCQKQPDRRVVISQNEIYLCSKNEWAFSTVLTTDKGREFIGYVMKRMESVLRKITKFKYKITAKIDMVSQETLSRLIKSGLYIENIVQAAVVEFYREATKVVVEVNHNSLARIRQEALATQESLIVEEQTPIESAPVAVIPPLAEPNIVDEPLDIGPAPVSDGWEGLGNALSKNELQAIAVILQGDNLKKFADKNNIMLEVLADGINEKAIDFIGDNILDDELAVYEDYEEQVKGMVESL